MKHCQMCDYGEDQMQEAKYRISITDMEGQVIETMELCEDCISNVRVSILGGKPRVESSL